MAFNIQNFREALNFDGARPNLFEVRIADRLGEDFTFMCKAAQIPGATIGTVEIPYFGRAVKLAGNRTFADWSITVINDEDYSIRHQFTEWMASINGHVENRAGGLSNDYFSDIEVIQYGKDGDAKQSFKLLGAFPTDLSAIELDWGSNDAIEEYQVTFSYQYWEGVDGNVRTDVL